MDKENISEEIDVDNLQPSPSKTNDDEKLEEAAVLSGDLETTPVKVEEEAKPKHGDDDIEALDDVNLKEEIKPYMEEQAPPLQHPPSFFTDDKGNLKFVNLVVRHPCKIFWFLLVLCFAITFALIAIVFTKGNPFTVPEDEFDLKDIRSIQYDSFRLAQDKVEGGRDSTAPAVAKQSEIVDLAYWVFEGEKPEGVFGSAESIQAMKDAFDIFLEDEGFSDFCLLNYGSGVSSFMDTGGNGTANTEPKCDTPLTPLSMYYASDWDSELVAQVIEELKDPEKVQLFNTLALCYTRQLYCELVPDDVSPENITYAIELGMNLTKISSTWDMKGTLVDNHTQATELASYMLQVDTLKGLVDFGYDKDFSVENPISHYSRGILFWGGPLEDRSDLTKDQKEDADDTDEEIRKDYILDNYLDDMDKQAEGGTHKTINSYYFMVTLILEVILQIVQRDAMLAIFSFIFVFFWLRINLGSWFLSFVAIFEIFFSVPVAWFLFTVVFQIKYFATLNALAIFVVAAIGADDVFIFMDAYKQSRHRNPHNLVDLQTRMSWVYRRTGTAMAITSATTCAAFLCTLITPLAFIKSFGVFAAVVIFVDYVLVMSLFCTAVVIYHDRFEDRSCCGCCCTDCSKTNPTPTQVALETLESAEEEEEEEFNCTEGLRNYICGHEGSGKSDVVGEFFKIKVAGFIKQPLHRLVLAVIFLTWLGIAIWQTSLIESTKEAEQFLDEDHPLQKSITILNNEFPVADDDLGLKVYYAWGIGEVDRSGVNLLLDPENFGTPTFVESFDYNEQCQEKLVYWCDQFRSNSTYHGLIKRKSGVGQVHCFMDELAAYAIKGDLSDCKYVTQGDWKKENWTIAPSDLPNLIPGFLKERSCYDEDNIETISVRYKNELGWDGESVRYAAIAVENEVLTPHTQDSESVTRAEYHQFVDLAAKMDRDVSQYCSGEVIMTDLDRKFVFMNNQAIFVQTAVQSSILGVAIAFVVLLLATHVFHIAFFASLSILCVLVSVTGTMVLLGWTLGSIESILIGIIAGFSVDYVVHLAHAYEVADGDPYQRVTEAFGDMGISVLNGMVTSVAASIPLFFCQLQFFGKFGVFLCLTIAFSWIFANFGFMSVLAQLRIPLKKKGCRL